MYSFSNYSAYANRSIDTDFNLIECTNTNPWKMKKRNQSRTIEKNKLKEICILNFNEDVC